MQGFTYLKTKLELKRPRVQTRYKYYEQKQKDRDFQISTPPSLWGWMSTLGWCSKAVDALADRLQFYEFRDDNFDMNSIFELNNADILYDSAILSALISSCCFIYIRADENGYPRLQVLDGGRATGIMDPITGMLEEGYAVLEEDENHMPLLEAYFIAGSTTFYPKGKMPYTIQNPAPYPLLVPIVYRPDAMRPFGHSRISRACMDIMGSAIRTIKRSEISAEFYSYPQKYVTGTSKDAEVMEKWKAAMSAMLEFTADENEENKVKVGQFTQQSMQPHTDQLKMFASLFAAETGLTLDDLGFVTSNPSSAESIKASHENLRLTARKAQRDFGTGFLNTGYLAACIRDDYPYDRSAVYLTKPSWLPVFEPDSSALSGIGDAVSKINTALPGYIDETKMMELTGF